MPADFSIRPSKYQGSDGSGIQARGGFEFGLGIAVAPQVEQHASLVVVGRGGIRIETYGFRELLQGAFQIELIGQRDSQVYMRSGRLGIERDDLAKIGTASSVRPVRESTMASTVSA